MHRSTHNVVTCSLPLDFFGVAGTQVAQTLQLPTKSARKRAIRQFIQLATAARIWNPKDKLVLLGTGCDANGNACFIIATDNS